MNITSVSDVLVKWYDDNCTNGRLAWSYLGRKSGVSVSNICKIAKGQVAMPKYETAKALLQAIYPNKNSEVYAFLVEYYPKKAIHLEVFLEKDRNRIFEADMNLLRDQLNYRLFKLAMAGTIKVADLEAEFGSDSLSRRVEILSKANLIVVTEDGALKRTDATVQTANGDVNWVAEEFIHGVSLLSQKKLMSRELEMDLDDRINKFLYFHWNVSDEAVGMIGAESSDFMNGLFRKYSQPKYTGSIPVFVNLACGRFDSK